MNTKQLYTAPEADLLVVRFEEMICTSPASVLLWGDALDPGPSFKEDNDHTYNY